jgi:hypothetical protein
VITTAMPPVSAIQTAASRSFFFTETSHAILARWAARTGWDFRDGHHVSGVLNHWIASRQLTEAAKGGDMDDVIVSLRLVLQLERVPCLPQ